MHSIRYSEIAIVYTVEYLLHSSVLHSAYQHALMVLSALMHSHTLLAEPNAIYSTHVCTATHVRPQVTPGNACVCLVDLYHLCTDHLYKYISSRVDTNILQFLTQGTTQLKLTLKQLQVRSRVLQVQLVCYHQCRLFSSRPGILLNINVQTINHIKIHDGQYELLAI